jgi:hypothetical protein
MSAHVQCTTHFLATGDYCPICDLYNIDIFLFMANWAWDGRPNITLFREDSKIFWWKRGRKNKLKNVIIEGPKAGRDPCWH